MPRFLRRERRAFTLNYTQLTHHTGKRKGGERARLRVCGGPARLAPAPGAPEQGPALPRGVTLGKSHPFLSLGFSIRQIETNDARPAGPPRMSMRLTRVDSACERWGAPGMGDRDPAVARSGSGVAHAWSKSLLQPYSPSTLTGLALTTHLMQCPPRGPAGAQRDNARWPRSTVSSPGKALHTQRTIISSSSP